MRYMGVGRRSLAILVDFIVSIVWTYPFLDIESSPGYFHMGLTGFPFLAVVGIWLAYFTVMEALFGATVGKFVTGIRVRRPDGTRIGFGTSVIRNLGRIVDWLPFLYLVGAIAVWTSPMRQRLGDRWADTVVVTASDAVAGAPASNAWGFGLPPVPAPPGPVAPPQMPPPPPVPARAPVVIPESGPARPAESAEPAESAGPDVPPDDAPPQEPDPQGGG